MQTIGPYEIVRELGRGAMGVVYEVRHPQIPRPLALKLALQHMQDEEGLLRFLREGEIMARVRHPNLVTVHAMDRCPQGPYLVTDLVQGQNLKSILDTSGPLTPEGAARIVRDLADAVHALHQEQALHRDLKPENVMLRPDGSPCLLDFGVARDQSQQSLTQTGQMVGTPVFMSPEQVEGDKSAYGPWTDVYGLGAILYTLLTGRFPAGGASLPSVLKAILVDEPPWPSTLRPDMPPALEEIVKGSLAKEPRGRPQSAADLRDQLDAFLAGELDAPSSSTAKVGVVLAALVVLAAVAAFVAAPRGEGPAATPAGGNEPTADSPTDPRPTDDLPLTDDDAERIRRLPQGLERVQGFRRVVRELRTRDTRALRDTARSMRLEPLAVLGSFGSYPGSRAFFVDDTHVVYHVPGAVHLLDLSWPSRGAPLLRSWSVPPPPEGLSSFLNQSTVDRDPKTWTARQLIATAFDHRLYRVGFTDAAAFERAPKSPIEPASDPMDVAPRRTLPNDRNSKNLMGPLSVSRSGELVALTSDWGDRAPHLFRLAAGTIDRLPRHPERADQCVFVAGPRLVTTQHNSVMLWSVEEGADPTREPVWTWEPRSEGHESINSIAAARDGEAFAIGRHFGSALVLDATTTEKAIELEAVVGTRLIALSFSPLGQYLYGVSRPVGVGERDRADKSLHWAWDLGTRSVVFKANHLRRRVNQLDVSPDGTLLVLGMATQQVEIWGAGLPEVTNARK